MRTKEIKNKINGIKKWGEKVKRKDYLYDFQQFETIISFGNSIYTGKFNIKEAEMDQRNLLQSMVKFNNKSKPKTKEGKVKKKTFDSVNAKCSL